MATATMTCEGASKSLPQLLRLKSSESLSVTLFLRNARQSFQIGGSEKLAYVAFGVLSLCGVYYVSDCTLGALCVWAMLFQVCAHALTLWKVARSGDAEGISPRSLVVYAFIYLLRGAANWAYVDYLPMDKAADWAYQFLDFVAFAIVCMTLAAMFCGPARQTVSEERFPLAAALGLVALFSALFPVGRIAHRGFDWAYVTASHLEPLAILPQIFLVAKQGRATALTGHSLAAIFIARCIMLVWCWCHRFAFMYPADFAWSVYFLVATQVVSVILLLDFVFVYGKSLAATGFAISRKISFGV